MIKNIKYLVFFLVLFLTSNCSFNNTAGIWTGGEDEKRRISELERQQKRILDVVKIYSSEIFYSEEIAATQNVALSAPKKNQSWQMSGFNQQNFLGNIYLTGINDKFLSKKIGKDKFSISRQISSPITFNDNIYFSDDTGSIFKISKRGKVQWKINIYKKIYKKIYKTLTFGIYKNHIYIADNIGFVYSVNLDNGKIVWIKNHGVPLKSKIKIFDEKIFLINQDNRILCFSAKDGTKLWDTRAIKSFIKSQHLLSLAISKDGYLLSLDSSGNLLKSEISRGKVFWSLNISALGDIHESDFFKSSDVVIADEDIIFATSSAVFSYNLQNGYLNWKVEIDSKNTPIVDGNNIFVVSDHGYFVNLDRNSGKINWSTNILKTLKKRKRQTYITGFILGSDKIYATTSNGFLIVSSATSGKVDGIKKIGDPIATTPIISNGSLYILTENSRIIGFN